MKIALLAPGPSLARARLDEHYDVVVGINRAAIRFTCDFFACGDYPMVQQARAQVIGVPTLYTAATSAQWLQDNNKPWLGGVETFESLYEYRRPQHELQWAMFTATAALWLCGAKIDQAAGGKGGLVRVFGVDMVGEADWDGEMAGNNRSMERWQLERAIWRNVANDLGSRRIAVERVV